jgi:hypothetical protein
MRAGQDRIEGITRLEELSLEALGRLARPQRRCVDIAVHHLDN